MTQYGYTRKKMEVVESTTQLLIEDKVTQGSFDTPSLSQFQAPSHPIISHSNSLASSSTASTNPSSSMTQKETRTQDGKKRIQPVLIRGLVV
jgi:hypothetical protein